MDHGYGSFVQGKFKFLINKIIIKTRFSGAFSCISEKDFCRTGPINRSHTHGTRFARGINLTTIQLKGLESLTSISYGYYFGMRCGIVSASHTVKSLANNFPILYNYTTKRAAMAQLHPLSGKFNCQLHEFLLILGHHTVFMLKITFFEEKKKSRFTARLVDPFVDKGHKSFFVVVAYS